MRFVKYAAAMALAAGMALGGGTPAHADNSYVEGTLNTSGSLVKYDYTRTHTFTGPISLSVDNLTGTNLRLGLRNMKVSGGPQFTSTLEWKAKGAKSWGTIKVGTRFAMQGRMNKCGWFCDNTWGGDLTY